MVLLFLLKNEKFILAIYSAQMKAEMKCRHLWLMSSIHSCDKNVPYLLSCSQHVYVLQCMCV